MYNGLGSIAVEFQNIKQTACPVEGDITDTGATLVALTYFNYIPFRRQGTDIIVSLKAYVAVARFNCTCYF
jgi:hypothetical protein